MFDTKKKSLHSNPASAATVSAKTSAFVSAGMKKQAQTRSGNGALKYSTTGNSFVDEFGQAGSFKAPRNFTDITKSMSTLWGESKLLCLKFLFYLRMITRKVQFPDGSTTENPQRGQGLRHEGIFRMMWLQVHQPSVFWKNILLFISVGSWKDIITMLSYDLQYNGWKDRKLDWDKLGKLILAGLENPRTTNLVKKYLPQIKTNSVCKTVEAQADNMIAKWICSLLFGGKPEANNASTYRKYRKLKTSGNAHEWQKLISQGKVLQINFDTVHGRALASLVSGKFLKNNGLEARYSKWLEGKPTVKYTGYVYELLGTIPTAKQKYQEDTINKQFATLVDTAKQGALDGTSLIVVRDTSGSMSSPATGTKMSCGDVAKALALFFSEMLPSGKFSNSWIEFHSNAEMRQWKGATVVDKWKNDNSSYVGGTNFQSVIKLFCTIKKTGVPEKEFPTGILCISDGEFNPAQLGKTNVETALATLKAAGFTKDYVDNFKIVLWNLQSGYYGRTTGKKFETYGGVKNVFYFSGLDGSVVSFLTGMADVAKRPPETAEELFEAAMDQEVLNMLEV